MTARYELWGEVPNTESAVLALESVSPGIDLPGSGNMVVRSKSYQITINPNLVAEIIVYEAGIILPATSVSVTQIIQFPAYPKSFQYTDRYSYDATVYNPVVARSGILVNQPPNQDTLESHFSVVQNGAPGVTQLWCFKDPNIATNFTGYNALSYLIATFVCQDLKRSVVYGIN